MKIRNKFKHFLCKTVLSVLGSAIKAVYCLDSEAKKEFNMVGNNFPVKFGIFNSNYALVFFLDEGRIKVLKGRKAHEFNTENGLEITFKNVQLASKVLLGKISVEDAYIRHGFQVGGDVNIGMVVIRIMNLVETYLFGKRKMKKLLEKVPNKQVSSLRVYTKIFLNV